MKHQIGVGLAIDARQVAVDTAAVSPEKLEKGAQVAGASVLGTYGGLTVGVWEISPGISTDVEVDELFVVISGEGTLAIEGQECSVDLRAGVLVRLVNGMRTRWVITEPLRKVYLV